MRERNRASALQVVEEQGEKRCADILRTAGDGDESWRQALFKHCFELEWETLGVNVQWVLSVFDGQKTGAELKSPIFFVVQVLIFNMILFCGFFFRRYSWQHYTRSSEFCTDDTLNLGYQKTFSIVGEWNFILPCASGARELISVNTVF